MAKFNFSEMIKSVFDKGERVAHWFVTLNNGYDTAKQKMPGILGLSKDDERIIAGYTAELSRKENEAITELMKYFPYNHQRRDFRLVVAGILNKKETKILKVDNKKSGKTANTEEKKEVIETVTAIKFLKKIARMIYEEPRRGDGLEKVYQFCLAREIIFEDKMSRQAIEWAQKQIEAIFNVDSLSEIGADTLNAIFAPDAPIQKKLDGWLERANNFRERCNK